MKLQDWLNKRANQGRGLTNGEFAKIVGISRYSVWRYCRGDRVPDRETMRNIMTATDREVMPNDFFD